MKKNQPTDPKTLDAIVEALKKGKTFSFSGHQNPDADVVGSQLALASLVRQLGSGKEIDIQNVGAPAEFLSFLPGFETVQNVEKATKTYDVIVIFECSGAERTGNIIDLKTQGKMVINLDHHLHNPNFGHINLVEPKTSSLSEIIYKIYEHAKVPLTKDNALCIFTGMVADTGFFRYSNTNSQTLSIAQTLLDTGLSVEVVSERMYLNRTVPSVRLMGDVLSNMTLHYDNRVALIKITPEMFEKYGATNDDLADVVNAGLMVNSVCASILLKEKRETGEIKLSLRSKGSYDINKVAREFGGGGHRNASGAATKDTLENVEKIILQKIKTIF